MVINKYLAELLGTFILVGLGSMGILSVQGANGPAEIIAIAFAFGFALLAGIWVVGHVSGAHFNPAVTLAMVLDGRLGLGDAVGYWIGQFAGASLASLVVAATSSTDIVGSLTATGYDKLNTAIVVEVLLTVVFVWTILAVTKSGANHAPAAIALTLVGIHLAGIPLSGASVNPARSFGPAVVGGNVDQLAVYIYAPLIGAVVAWALYRMFSVDETA